MFSLDTYYVSEAVDRTPMAVSRVLIIQANDIKGKIELSEFNVTKAYYIFA